MCIDPKDIRLYMTVEESLRDELKERLKTYPVLLKRFELKTLTHKEGNLINRLLKKDYFYINSSVFRFPWEKDPVDSY